MANMFLAGLFAHKSYRYFLEGEVGGGIAYVFLTLLNIALALWI